jgi:hypothetical protein
VLAENPNTIVVESGNLAYSTDASEPTTKLNAVAKTFKSMNYAAVGVGPVDALLGDKFCDALRSNSIPVVHVDDTDREGVQPYLIKVVAGVRVGIVSFGAGDDSVKLLRKRYEAYAEARRKSDYLILLDQANIATDEWLAKSAARFGAPDVVIGGANNSTLTEARQVGSTLVVPTSRQGLKVGRIDLTVDGTSRAVKVTQVAMDPTIVDDPDISKLVSAYTEEQRRLTQIKVAAAYRYNQSPAAAVANDPKTAEATRVDAMAQGPYYNYQDCATCHKKEYEHWKSTPHAKALRVLTKSGKTIAECLPCHSEMYRRTESVVTDETLMLGVECASCHESVLPHNGVPAKREDATVIRAQCLKCHQKERSPGFDPEKSYEAVKHFTR